MKELEQRLAQFNIQPHQTTPKYKKNTDPGNERLLLKVMSIMCYKLQTKRKVLFGQNVVTDFLRLQTFWIPFCVLLG